MIAGAGAGLVAGVAYLAGQTLDLRLAGTRADDLAIHGRLLSADPFWWRAIGAVMHLGFGAAVGAAYAAWGRRRLTARLPPWAAGVIFLQLENALLYPLLIPLQRRHAAWREGLLESYFRPVTYAQQVWRHLVFGAVLGALLGPEDGPGGRSELQEAAGVAPGDGGEGIRGGAQLAEHR